MRNGNPTGARTAEKAGSGTPTGKRARNTDEKKYVPSQKTTKLPQKKARNNPKKTTGQPQKKGRKNAPLFFCCESALGLFDQARLDGLGADPQTLNRTAGSAYAYALDIRLECALVLLDELKTDTAALLALTFVDNLTAFYRTFAGDCAYS